MRWVGSAVALSATNRRLLVGGSGKGPQEAHKSSFIARDGENFTISREPFSPYPIYYSTDGRETLISLVPDPGSKEFPTIDLNELARCLVFRHPSADRSPLSGLSRLEAGTEATLSDKINCVTHYAAEHHPADLLARIALSQPRAQPEISALRETVLTSLRASLSNKEPGAIPLSSGLDSSFLLRLAVEWKIPVSAMVLRLDSPEFDEGKDAVSFAKNLGVPVIETRVEYHEVLPLAIRAIRALGAPLVVPHLVLLQKLAETAKELNAPWIASGEAADEIFGGYPRFSKPSSYLFDGMSYVRSLQIFEPEELQIPVSPPGPGYVSVHDHSGVSHIDGTRSYDIRYRMIPYHLERTALLHAALGISTIFPYWDEHILRDGFMFSPANGPDDIGKWGLRQVAQGLLHDELRLAPKRPCGAPLEQWFNQGLSTVVADYVWEQGSISQSVFTKSALEDAMKGVNDRHFLKRWGILLLELWYRNRPFSVSTNPLSELK